MSKVLIRAQGLKLGFPSRVLIDGLDFNLAEGGRMGLTGRSGLGKTTLLDTIARKGIGRHCSSVQSGALEVMAGPIGYAPQRDSLPEWFRVARLRDGLIRRAPENRRARLRGIFKDFGLDALQDSYPRSLSGGERQRLNLAIALALVGNLLILDEPLTELDSATKAEILKKVSLFLHAENVALILVSHDLDVLLRLSDVVHLLGPRGILHSLECNCTAQEEFLARRRNELFDRLSASECKPT